MFPCPNMERLQVSDQNRRAEETALRPQPQRERSPVRIARAKSSPDADEVRTPQQAHPDCVAPAAPSFRQEQRNNPVFFPHVQPAAPRVAIPHPEWQHSLRGMRSFASRHPKARSARRQREILDPVSGPRARVLPHTTRWKHADSSLVDSGRTGKCAAQSRSHTARPSAEPAIQGARKNGPTLPHPSTSQSQPPDRTRGLQRTASKPCPSLPLAAAPHSQTKQLSSPGLLH